MQSTWFGTLEVQDLRVKGHHVMLRVTFHPQDHKKKREEIIICDGEHRQQNLEPSSRHLGKSGRQFLRTFVHWVFGSGKTQARWAAPYHAEVLTGIKGRT